MYPVTDQFKSQVMGSHRQRCQVDVLKEGTTIATGLPVLSGQATFDSGRAIRGSCSLTFFADGLVPLLTTDLLYPAANEIALKVGVDLDGGTTEWVPYGVYSFEDVEIDESQDGLALSLSGSDRGAMAARSLLTEPVVVAKGTSAYDAIAQLLSTVRNLPGVSNQSTSIDPTWLTPLAVYDAGTDPWGAAVSIATAFGVQLYLDRTGVPVMADVPDPDNVNPAATYDVDSGAPVIRLNRNVSTVNTYNGVVASGEGTDLVRPLRATAWDDDPTSPFYYQGPYGAKPFFYSSPLILTADQASQAARAKLKQLMGGIEMLGWDMVPHPALDVYDVVAVKREQAGVNDNYVIESVTLPLGGGPMTCSGRTSILATEALG